MDADKTHQGDQMLGSYQKLFLALGISLPVMFVLSIAFVNTWSHFYLNLSNFYMALLMVAPMGFIMLVVMKSMFTNKRLNAGLVVGFVLLFIGAFWMGHDETFVGNEQFLRAMIPHHSRAILVCENAAITDPDIQSLCNDIVEAQKREIGIMQEMLGE